VDGLASQTAQRTLPFLFQLFTLPPVIAIFDASLSGWTGWVASSMEILEHPRSLKLFNSPFLDLLFSPPLLPPPSRQFCWRKGEEPASQPDSRSLLSSKAITAKDSRFSSPPQFLSADARLDHPLVVPPPPTPRRCEAHFPALQVGPI